MTGTPLARPRALALTVAFGLALASALLATPSSARANTRYALVVGANTGDAGDVPLAFAERDATRMADVLTRLGGVMPEDLLLLLGPDADSLGRAIDAFASRIVRTEGDADGGHMLFIYFSGHADAQALHLRGTRLSFRELKSRVARLGADVSVFIVDACRSGGLVRMKGATPAEVRTEFHKRLVNIVSLLLLPFLAIPFAVGSRRSRRSSRFGVALVLIVVFHEIIEQGSVIAGRGNLSPVIALWGPFALLAVFASAGWSELPWPDFGRYGIVVVPFVTAVAFHRVARPQ